MNAIAQLKELDAKLTKTIELRSKEDGEEKGWPKNRIGLPAGSLAVGAGIGAGAYRYGADAMDAMKRGATLGNAASIAKRKISEDLTSVSNRYKTAKRSFRASRGLHGKGVVSSVATAARKAIGFSEKQIADKIIALDAKIDEIAEIRKARKAKAKA